MNAKRLYFEHASMMEHWQGKMHLLADPQTGEPMWVGHVVVYNRALPITAVYPEEYPCCPPRVYAGVPIPPGTPHMLPNNEICWHEHAVSGPNKWDPAHDTAAMAIGAVQHWWAACLIYVTTGKWPPNK